MKMLVTEFANVITKYIVVQIRYFNNLTYILLGLIKEYERSLIKILYKIVYNFIKVS